MQTNLTPTVLRTESVSLQKQSRLILANLSCEMHTSEFVGLIGPNGAGKSSLLKMLAGLQLASSGNIYINHQELTHFARKQRAQMIAYLPQQEKPSWPLTVEHLVGLGRLPWQGFFAQSSVDKQAIDLALEQTELQAFRQRNILELSGGELQRALIARLFAGQQNILLVDEPIVALDPYHQLHVMELLAEKAQKGALVCAALHDLNLAAVFCTQLVLLNQGKIVAIGSPIEVLTSKNLFDVYGIDAYVDCREEGVVIIPRKRYSPKAVSI